MAERAQRGKAEKSRAVLSEDLADILDRLEEAGAHLGSLWDRFGIGLVSILGSIWDHFGVDLG